MKLVDLNPHWITLNGWSADEPFYIGVSFLCPHCPRDACQTCGHDSRIRLPVQFWPPIDPANWEARISPVPHDKFHTRAGGETFDTLTITPSIGFESIGHWHGRITNGECA